MSEQVRVKTYCAMCTSSCGAEAVLEDGKFIALEPDPSHPAGAALCSKGRAAPEMVVDPQRLLHPLRRTRPKGDPDPGWKEITWDEALGTVAERLQSLANESGPESVAFTHGSPTTTSFQDSWGWLARLKNAFGTPTHVSGREICNWASLDGMRFTFGAPVGGADYENSGCMVFWGHNPGATWLSRATLAVAARKRGTRVVVVDPRRVGFAATADTWLRVRPGADGALALSLASVLLANGWYDGAFVRRWTNGPLLVHPDTGLLLTESDVSADGSDNHFLAWDRRTDGLVLYDAGSGEYERSEIDPALNGVHTIATRNGPLQCRPAFDLYVDLCQRFSPQTAEDITWVPAKDVEEAARLLWESRPVSFSMWSGINQQTNATQTARAIGLLMTLLGDFDAAGGNVQFPLIPSNNVMGLALLPPEQRAKTIGLDKRPIGPPATGEVIPADFYTAVLEGTPYPVRGLVNFGGNLLLAHGDVLRGKEALTEIEFSVVADMYMTPTAELADVVLPIASCWERPALKFSTGPFGPMPPRQRWAQWRSALVDPIGETRSDTEIIFELATRLGLGEHFWEGDVEAAYRFQIEPSGFSLDDLRAQPGAHVLPDETRLRKYEASGFQTPTKKVEIYSQTLARHGYEPLPEFVEPSLNPHSRPDLKDRYPLVLTCTKVPQYCTSQHRSLPRLRRLVPDPELEIHSDAAADRGIAAGDWVAIESPTGRIRAVARLNDSLDPRVVCGQGGWWQSLPEQGRSGFDALDETGANFNLLISSEDADPISGSVAFRSYLCEVRKV